MCVNQLPEGLDSYFLMYDDDAKLRNRKQSELVQQLTRGSREMGVVDEV